MCDVTAVSRAPAKEQILTQSQKAPTLSLKDPIVQEAANWRRKGSVFLGLAGGAAIASVVGGPITGGIAAIFFLIALFCFYKAHKVQEKQPLKKLKELPDLTEAEKKTMNTNEEKRKFFLIQRRQKLIEANKKKLEDAGFSIEGTGIKENFSTKVEPTLQKELTSSLKEEEEEADDQQLQELLIDDSSADAGIKETFLTKVEPTEQLQTQPSLTIKEKKEVDDQLLQRLPVDLPVNDPSADDDVGELQDVDL